MTDSVWNKQWKRLRDQPESILELDSFAFRIYEKLLQEIPQKTNQQILEAGFGTGRYLASLQKDLPDNHYAGFDYSPDSVQLLSAYAKKKQIQNIQTVHADIRRLPFAEQTFDVVFSEGVIIYFEEYAELILKLATLLKPGGKLIIMTPNRWNFIYSLTKLFGKGAYRGLPEKSFWHGELKHTLENVGLTNIKAYAVHPTYAVERLRFCGKFGCLIDRLIAKPLDLISNEWFGRQFGFYLIACGYKP